MGNSPINNAVSGLKAFSKQLEYISGNVANAETIGGKGMDGDFLTIVTTASGSSSRSGGGVMIVGRQSVDVQGDLEYTGRDVDLALDGSGMFIVNSSKDGSGQYLYTRACSLRTDERGNFITANGDVLMVWGLDSEGRRPGEVGNIDATSNSLLSSLSTFNVQDITGLASATTKVDIGVTLNASTHTIQGAGETLEFRRSSNSLNASAKETDVIVPSNDGFGNISEGDSISITANPPNRLFTFVYGGVAISNDITAIPGGIFGATTTSAKFSTATNGDTLRLTSNGRQTDFIFKSAGTPVTTRGEFDSLTTLAQAINFTPEFTARITNNQLYISTKNGDQGISFSNISGNFKAALGLQDIQQSNNRFSSIAGLKNLINNSQGLTANDSGTGGIKILADTPTGQFEISGNSVGNINNTATAVLNSNLISVTHQAHGLNPGDYINVSGFMAANGVQVPDGIYTIATTPDPDTFTIRASTNATAAGALNNSFAWSKGAIGLPVFGGVVSTAATPVITTTIGPTASTIQITQAGHGLVNNDVIHMSGFNTGPNGAIVPNGYYKVTVIDPNNFTLDVAAGAGATGAGAVALNHDITWQKVIDATTNGATAAAFATNGGTPILTTNGSATVRVYTPNAAANYSIGDVFHFNGVMSNGYYNNIFLNNQDSFVVTTVGPNYIEFADTGIANATGYLANPNLAGISTNKFNHLFTELGLSTTKFKYGPAYNVEGGSFGSNFSENSNISGVYSEPLTIYDSLGISHNFMMSFGKLANNTWAVEIYSMENSDGSYDIETARADGQVAAGILNFNGDGSLSVVDPILLNAVEISWKNGAESSQIIFDWGTAGVPKNTPGATTFGDINGMKQINAPSERRFLDTNGIQPGLLNSITVDDQGIVIAGFTNGSTRKVFQIPIASFTNYNGLSEVSGNAYISTYESGSPNLKTSGDDASVGKINSQSLEQSNIDLSTQLTNMIISQRNYQANTKVVKIANELLEALDRIL